MTDVHDWAAGRLRAAGLRYTTVRRAVVDALRATDRPRTTPELLAARDDLAQSSLYRNLVVLERAGVVHRIVTHDDFARYELAEDLAGHHHHRICARCGTIDDFKLSAQLEGRLERALRRVAARSDFRTSGHRLDLVGVCADCQ